MLESDHTLIFWSIVILDAIVAAGIVVGIWILCRSLKKMMAYHNDFAAVHVEMHNDINRVIERQGQLAGILRTTIVEARNHDKKVDRVLKSLGETTNGDANPGP